MVIGSTGSIGTQALALVRKNPQLFKVVGLAAGKNLDLLATQVELFRPEIVCVADEKDVPIFEGKLSKPTRIVFGAQGLKEISSRSEADRVLVASSGTAGILPTISALEAGKTVALANKECIVSAPELLHAAIVKGGGKLIPVDSEHSALFQLMLDRENSSIDELLLTASGGPFRGKTTVELEKVSIQQALQHPKWSMGSKITVDSATLMNKAFELIEAVRLFGVSADSVRVMVHPQSIIHGAIYLTDGVMLAHASVPDMAAAIGFGLTFPAARIPSAVSKLDLLKEGTLSFEAIDEINFPALQLARSALRSGSQATAVFHIANECLVVAFLEGKCSFMSISRIVESALAHFSESRSIESIEDFDELYPRVSEFVTMQLN